MGQSSRRHGTHPVWWVIALSLAAIALNLTFRGQPLLPVAEAQAVRSAGARGIFAFSGQLTAATYGVYVVDTDAGTLWCYEIAGNAGTKRLRLVSARSWIFDRYLKNYNIEGPTEADVKEMVGRERNGVVGEQNAQP